MLLNPAVNRYDWIISTEVVEHLYDPLSVLAKLDSLLDCDNKAHESTLCIMTQPWDDNTQWLKWWYIRDPTHVVIYSDSTMKWIADKFNWQLLDRPSRDVFIFSKRKVEDAATS